MKREWADIFGKPLSLHMSPATFKKGELLINVDSPMWLQQISFYKEDIIRKLQSFGVRAVRLRLGRVLPEKKQAKEDVRMRPLTSGDISYIEATIASVKDPALKQGIKQAIEKSVAFRR